MRLVVDANILFSALLKKGFTRELILREGIELFAPEFIIDEFMKHLEELSRKTNLEESRLKRLFDEFIEVSGLKIVPKEDFEKYIEKAERISPDPNDSVYFALALNLDCPIWSQDKKLKEQDSVKIVNTEDLV